MDNVFIERLWHSLKYEEVYLQAYDTVRDARVGMRRWMDFYNQQRKRQALDRCTPDNVYCINMLHSLPWGTVHENPRPRHSP